MSPSWFNPRDPLDLECGAVEIKAGREGMYSSSAVPGSPSIVFLTCPVVVERKPGEKTGLLPTQNR